MGGSGGRALLRCSLMKLARCSAEWMAGCCSCGLVLQMQAAGSTWCHGAEPYGRRSPRCTSSQTSHDRYGQAAARGGQSSGAHHTGCRATLVLQTVGFTHQAGQVVTVYRLCSLAAPPQVYECSADICVRAQDLGEALKCLRQLVELIYAALAVAERQQRQRQQQQAMSLGALAPPPGLAQRAAGPEGTAGSVLGTVLATPALARWPEMAAALILYYKCHPAQTGEEGLDTAITLRRLPAELLRCAEVQRSLRLVAALGAGDYVAFLRQLRSAPLLVQLLARARLEKVGGRCCC